MPRNLTEFFRSPIVRVMVAYTIGLNVSFLAAGFILVLGAWAGHPNEGGFLAFVIGLLAGIAAGIGAYRAMKKTAG